VWPKHVLRQDWLPLNDLLGHVNTRLLISHCGANSQFEVSIKTRSSAAARRSVAWEIRIRGRSKVIGNSIDEYRADTSS